MRPSSHRLRRLLPRLAASVGAIALPLAAAAAEPPPPPPPTAAPPAPATPAAGIEDSLQKGARYFDQAIAWVARGGSLGRTRDFYARLEVKWDLPHEHHEGSQEFWFAMPDKMRTVQSAAAQTTTKILNGEQAWQILVTGAVKRIHGTPDGEATLKQLKEDLVRIQDLTAFVTLEGLKGPGIVFEFEKRTEGKGVYEGRWLKVNRRSPDGRKMTFWLAYETNERDEVVRATWPGVVRVDGDVAQKLHTEDWILKDWDSPATARSPFRYPRKIEGWQLNPDKKAAETDRPHRFVSAVLEDVRMNQGIEPQKFEDPAKVAPPR
jgi:hypothetical protein